MACNCTELARVAGVVDEMQRTIVAMNSGGDANNAGLVELADNATVVILAYVFVILPWGFLYNFDFITEKWRSVHRTRNLARLHLAIAISPMPFILFYAHLQHISQDYKEMMAAVIGILMCLYHVTRTVWGIVQLDAFSRWCVVLLHRMKHLDMISPVKFDKLWGSTAGDWKSMLANFERILMINNSVIDNELGGTDLTVSFSWQKVDLNLPPCKWLRTMDTELVLVRWGGAFLSSFGEFWGGDLNSKSDIEEFYEKCPQTLDALQRVTFLIDGKRESVGSIDSVAGGPYDTTLHTFGLREMQILLEPRQFELDDLMGSFPGDLNQVARYPAMGLVCALQYAQSFKKESFEGLVDYNRRFLTPRNTNGWHLLLWQTRELPDNNISRVLTKQLGAPFPWGQLMVPLWDNCTNWRVLQATVHKDNRLDRFKTRHLGEISSPPSCWFEYTRRRISQQPNFSYYFGYVGAVMEMVRSFLANWIFDQTIADRSRNIDWEPLIPSERLVFPTLKSYDLSGAYHEQLEEWRWECQCILQDTLANMDRNAVNLPASTELILLFILAFPRTTYKKSSGGSTKVPVIIEAGTSSENNINDVDVISIPSVEDAFSDDVVVLTFGTWIAPQDIKARIEIHGNDNKVAMSLVLENSLNGETRFKWEDWINSAMGYLKGVNDKMMGESSQFSKTMLDFGKRTPSKADLSRPMLLISPPHPNLPDLPGKIPIWTGWPFFDIKIVQFELNQWMRAAGFLHHGKTKVVQPKVSHWERDFKREVDLAEIGLLRITQWNRS